MLSQYRQSKKRVPGLGGNVGVGGPPLDRETGETGGSRLRLGHDRRSNAARGPRVVSRCSLVLSRRRRVICWSSAAYLTWRRALGCPARVNLKLFQGQPFVLCNKDNPATAAELSYEKCDKCSINAGLGTSVTALTARLEPSAGKSASWSRCQRCAHAEALLREKTHRKCPPSRH